MINQKPPRKAILSGKTIRSALQISFSSIAEIVNLIFTIPVFTQLAKNIYNVVQDKMLIIIQKTFLEKTQYSHFNNLKQ